MAEVTGKWRFRDGDISFTYLPIEHVNFTCGGFNCISFLVDEEPPTILVEQQSESGESALKLINDGTVIKDEYKDVDFGDSRQTVSQDFYDWFFSVVATDGAPVWEIEDGDGVIHPIALREDSMAKSVGYDDTMPMSQKATTNAILMAGLQGVKSAEKTLVIDDVSPIEHEMNVKVKSKNVIPEDSSYVDVSSVSLESNGVTYPVGDDGVVSGVKSVYPTTTLTTNTEGVIIECEYNRDINKAFAELQEAITGSVGNIPIEVSTSEQLDAILATASDDDIGKAYKYTGESTEKYENGAIYVITKAD